MNLVTGNGLRSERFFSRGAPKARGSSFDLTIGDIFDAEGKLHVEPFSLKPGHLVQVVSKEVFELPKTITGHVTYKTALTRRGIWALTVGIVDPGWRGPVTTTLLNFSRVDYAISPGESFLRVSFFEHEPVNDDCLPAIGSVDAYSREVQKSAMTLFPSTFLNQDRIVQDAGGAVLDRIRKEALVWIAAVGILFTLANLVPKFVDSGSDNLRTRIERLEARLR